MPVEIGHCRQQRLDVFEGNAVLIVVLSGAPEFIGAQAAYADRVPLPEHRDVEFSTPDRDTSQPRSRSRQSIKHGAIVAAVRAWLHQDTAVEAESVEQPEV